MEKKELEFDEEEEKRHPFYKDNDMKYLNAFFKF